jgi:Cu/Ag efflux protein CusF
MAQPAMASTGIRAKVVAIDPVKASVTLDHEAIPALDWPPMTMAFKLRHPDQLQGVKVGDPVRVEVNVKPEDGDYLIDQLHKDSAP